MMTQFRTLCMTGAACGLVFLAACSGSKTEEKPVEAVALAVAATSAVAVRVGGRKSRAGVLATKRGRSTRRAC